MLKTTTSRLAFALLGYVTLIILLLTLNPFYLAVPGRIRFALQTTPGDAVSNVILFLPIGFLYRLTTQRRGAWLLGAVISALVLEFLAGFQAGTGASLMRVMLVIASALCGGVIYHFLRDHVRYLLGHTP